MPVAADVADLPLVAEGLGIAGIAAGGVFAALWNLEKQQGARQQQELQETQAQVQQLQQQLNTAQQQVQQEQKVGHWLLSAYAPADLTAQ